MADMAITLAKKPRPQANGDALADPVRWRAGRRQAGPNAADLHRVEEVTDSSADAIATYHELLTDEVAAESQGQLASQLRSRGLFFGERPICTVLRPRLMSPGRHRALQTGVAAVMAAFARAHEAGMADPAVREQFCLEPWEEQLIACSPGFTEPSPTSRLDAFFVDDALWFTEYNAETRRGQGTTMRCPRRSRPAGDATVSPAIRVRPLPRVTGSSGPARRLRAVGRPPRATRHRHPGLEGRAHVQRVRPVPEYFRDQGIPCEIVDPREVETGRVGFAPVTSPSHLIYKRVLLSELVGREGRDSPVLRAVRDGRSAWSTRSNASCSIRRPA